MQKYSVSIYKAKNNVATVKQTKGNEIDLFEVLQQIKNGTYKKQVLTLRKLYSTNKNEYDKQKVLLDAFTPSGTFETRKATAINNHSGLLCIDIDNVKDATDIKEATSLDKFVLAAFISPSGAGVKIIVRINLDKHQESFFALKNFYELQYGYIIDEVCKDVSRLCFVSYDQDIFINDAAIVYTLPVATETTKTKERLLFEVETITKRIEAKKIDITQGYENWLKLGFALAEGLGEAGRNFYNRLSVFNVGYSEDATNNQYNECLKVRKKGATITSFFWLCKESKIDVFVEVAPSPLKSQQKNTGTGKFKNNYGEEITDRERIETAITEIFEVRRNIILDKIECKELESEKQVWQDANEDDISRELEFKRVKNCNPNRIKSILNSRFVKPYNPFKEYFESLPSYNKKVDPDYIQQLADIVQLKDETQDRERFNRHFKKALVRCVACSLSEDINNLNYNKHAIIFISPNQSIGKTGFIRFLIPKPLELYCIERMTFGNRDEQFAMQSSFIINLDEMADIDERNLQSVKTAMSTGIINVRKMNSGSRLIQPRRCNFWGNTNETHILKDDTGSVRWLCFEVLGFNKDKEYWKSDSELFVDINKVWAMSYKLFFDGFPFQLTPNEIQENETANEMYKEESIESQLIKATFKKGSKDRQHFKTSVEIQNILSIKHPIFYAKLNSTKLGSALRKLGFIYGQEYDRLKGYQMKGYYVIE